jgi:hypothetical protein
MAGTPVQKERDRFGRQAKAATSPIDRRRRRDRTRHQVSFAHAGGPRRPLHMHSRTSGMQLSFNVDQR